MGTYADGNAAHLAAATAIGTPTTATPPSGILSYLLTQSDDDLGQPTTIYPDRDSVLTGYTSQGCFSGLSTTPDSSGDLPS